MLLASILLLLQPRQFLMSLSNIEQNYHSTLPPSISNESVTLGSLTISNVDTKSLLAASGRTKIANLSAMRQASPIINSDDQLYDNLPFERYSKNGLFAKRDFFNYILGKDWPGRSLLPQNLSTRLLATLDPTAVSTTSLRNRINSVVIKTLNEEIALMNANAAAGEPMNPETLSTLESSLSDALNDKNFPLQRLIVQLESDEIGKSEFLFNAIATLLSNYANTNDPPPYRGAIGFDPHLDTPADVANTRPYTSGYDLFAQTIESVLSCKIVAALAERGGGAVVLQRGNEKEFCVIDCTLEESLGISFATSCVILVEDALMTERTPPTEETTKRAKRALHEIYDHQEVSSLSLADKISLLKLRVRPRVLETDTDRVESEVNELILVGCDEMVRRELRVQQAVSNDDFKLAAQLVKGRSRRHLAYVKGDLAEFELLTSLRSDNTIDVEEGEDGVDGGWNSSTDISELDEWYERNRMKLVERLRKRRQQ